MPQTAAKAVGEGHMRYARSGSKATPGQRWRTYAVVACALAVGGALWTQAVAGTGDQRAYLPFCLKPVPTPTPTPRILDVRVDDACSQFRGGGSADPNGEYVCLKNHDTQAVSMVGWQLLDASQHGYTFPAFLLAPQALVRVHSGAGTDTASDLFWGSHLIWNNDHDTVRLYDALGRLVSRYVY